MRQEDGRYQVRVPWIPGSTLMSTNEQASLKRLRNFNKKLIQNQRLKEEYEKEEYNGCRMSKESSII